MMLIKQPNGFIAVWDGALCDLVEMNLPPRDALRLRSWTGRRYGWREIRHALDRRDPQNLEGPRNFDAWKRCMRIIKRVHGRERQDRRDELDMAGAFRL